MTPLQIIDKVEAHLKTMSRRAEVNGACLFRTPEGAKCAIGCLVPDELYNPEWEIRPGAYTFAIKALLVNKGIEMTIPLFVSLQGIHDDPDNWSDTGFIGNFTDLRGSYGQIANN